MAGGIKKISEYILKEDRALILTKQIDPLNLSLGTLNINYDTGTLKFVKLDANNKNHWANFNPANIFDQDSIVGNLVQKKSITNDHLVDATIDASLKIKPKTITSGLIKDASILTAHIMNGQISKDLLAAKSIDNSKIIDGEVISSKIRDKNITFDKLDDNLQQILNSTVQVKNNSAYIKGNVTIDGNVNILGTISEGPTQATFAGKKYTCSNNLEIGDTVEIVNNTTVKLSTLNTSLFLGVITSTPTAIMVEDSKKSNYYIAMVGTEYIKTSGALSIGQYVKCSGNGYVSSASASDNLIGKAIESTINGKTLCLITPIAIK